MSRAPEEAGVDVEPGHSYSEFYDHEEELYYYTKPPPKSFLGSVYEREDVRASLGSRPPSREHGFLQRYNTRSFETARTDCSSSGGSFSTSGYTYRSSSSFQSTSRSRSSTLAAEYTPPAIRFAPTPIPQSNTFVDELVPSVTSSGSLLISKLRTQITTEQQDKPPHQYPTPWEKKKRAWRCCIKFWNRKKELDWGERYDIWMRSKNAVRCKQRP